MSHSGKCTLKWQPGRKCHCAGCCENFSTVGNFDKHRRDGKCIPPAEVLDRAGQPTLTLNKRGVWVTPGEVDYDDRFGR